MMVRVWAVGDARRIAFEARRNLSMVGYNAVARSTTLPGAVGRATRTR